VSCLIAGLQRSANDAQATAAPPINLPAPQPPADSDVDETHHLSEPPPVAQQRFRGTDMEHAGPTYVDRVFGPSIHAGRRGFRWSHSLRDR